MEYKSLLFCRIFKGCEYEENEYKIKRKASLSSLGLNSSIDNAITVKEVKPVIKSARTVTPKKKVVKSQPITSNAILYKEELKDMKKKLLKQAKKSNKNANMEMIDFAFESADNRKSMEKDMNDYLKLVAMHLSIMEIESNFNNSVICKNPTTLDIGIMQVNTSVVNYIRKGLKNQYLNPYDLKDNIEMGSSIIKNALHYFKATVCKNIRIIKQYFPIID